jgi:cellulose synthase/poly-beta-1,6-N-acetylglucosamine synthase-like glycosyltransferase
MKLSAHPNGPGAAMSRKLLLESNGYDVTSICEDTEYTFNRMLEGKTIRFVEDAVVYEDLPSTGHDTAIRNKRIAAGNKVLLKEKMGKMLKMFFKTFKFTYLETYTTYIWVSIGGIFFTWFLLFFAYFFIFGGLAANNFIPLSMFNTQYFSSAIFTALIAIAITVAAFYLLFGMLVPTVMTATEYKKYGAKKKSQFVGLVFFFIIYVLFYAFSLMFGGMKKNVKWEQVKRNSDYYDKK